MIDYYNNDLWIANKLYSTKEALSINDNYKLKVIDIDSDNKIVVIDNFYSNPDLLREIAFNSTAHIYNNVGFPGFRSEYWIGNNEVYNSVRMDILKEVFDIDINQYSMSDPRLTFNISKAYKEWDNIDNKNKPNCQPHCDTIDSYDTMENLGILSIASVAFLNKDDEWNDKSGTAIYRHKKTGLVKYPSSKIRDEIINEYNKNAFAYGFGRVNGLEEIIWNNSSTDCEGWINESNDEWELEQFIEMKYNRLMIYSGELFHSAYINPLDFTDVVRITQPGFMRLIHESRGKENSFERYQNWKHTGK